MKRHVCQQCGEQLLQEGENYRCPYCGAIYDKGADLEELASFVAEEKLALLSNRRRLLWDAAHRENVSSTELFAAAQDVLSIFAEDEMARFYLACLDKEPAALNHFLTIARPDPTTAKEVLRFSLLNLDVRNVFALKAYFERSLKGDALLDAYNKVEKEAERVEEGVYLTNLPRDVFLAYSSADLPLAISIADFLEENEFTVFVAVRNLRHGKGAKENYQDALHDAMAHCKTLVFVSTENSRRLSCDAMRFELPYIRDHLPKMNRVEYLGQEYGPQTKFAAKSILRSVFANLEWCRDKEDLVERLLRFESAAMEAPAPKPKKTKTAAKESAPKAETPNPQPEPTPEPSTSKGRGFMKNLFSNVAKNVKAGLAKSPLTRDYPNIDDPSLEVRNGVLIRYKGNHKNLGLPEGITSIGPHAFRGSTVEVLQLPSTVKDIQDHAFQGSMITKIGFPKTDSFFVGEGAFQNCPRLFAIAITADKLTLDANAFRDCPSLSVVVLQGEEISIDLYTFMNCKKLERFETGKSTRKLTIGEGAFQNCASLKTFVPRGTEFHVGPEAFLGCRLSRRLFPRKADVDKKSGLR